MDIVKNVAIIILNERHEIFLGKRCGIGWSMPQGDIINKESSRCGIIREIKEEIGINITEVKQISGQFYYTVPAFSPFIKKQFWYTTFLSSETKFDFNATDRPEFQDFIWTDKETVIKKCIWFKRAVYKSVLARI